jgi:4-hydroxybenzoate polyprenyltransferase
MAHTCTECDYSGRGKISMAGILLIVLLTIFFFVSVFMLPPLVILIWPILAIIVAMTPLFRRCPDCGGKIGKGHSHS